VEESKSVVDEERCFLYYLQGDKTIITYESKGRRAASRVERWAGCADGQG
jgi:hypothetical protein